MVSITSSWIEFFAVFFFGGGLGGGGKDVLFTIVRQIKFQEKDRDFIRL